LRDAISQFATVLDDAPPAVVPIEREAPTIPIFKPDAVVLDGRAANLDAGVDRRIG
jgi:hypothetical protein